MIEITEQPNDEWLKFSDPVEMLLFLDDNLLGGVDRLHGWQIQFMKDFARDYTANKPFKAVVRAANGSGKDKFIIAACVTWFTMEYSKSVSVVTSKSGTQLDRQTNTYIEQLAEAYNTKLGAKLWKINYRHYEFLPSKSTVELFVTDEAGRAEGWHPVIPNGKFAIFTSESKSISDEIFVALARCTGFTHRVDVSSPGLPFGHFFNVCTTAEKRPMVTEFSGQWVEYHITAYDCSHLSLEYIEDLKKLLPGGETGAAFRSCVLAEFGDSNETSTVIPYAHVWRAVHKHTVGWLKEPHNAGGLDLSAGGDETVLTVRNGNKQLAIIPFKFDNTQDTIYFLEDKFEQHELKHHEAKIYADAGGLGKPIIDQLRSRGWSNIKYVDNRRTAYQKRVYNNRGTEMWFEFGKLLEKDEIWLLNDSNLVRQLASRYHKPFDNTHKLESKLQARAAGRPSPDRGDATVLCFSEYKSQITDEYTPEEPKPFAAVEEKPLKPDFDMRVWVTEKESKRGRYAQHTTPQEQFGKLQELVNAHNEQVRKSNI